jgi:hypothetical protein
MSTVHEGFVTYWLTPVRSDESMAAKDVIHVLVGQERIYAFNQKVASVRASLKSGDWICFYASAIGIVAHARALGKPEAHKHPQIDYDRYHLVIRLDDPQLYLDNPVVIDAAVRKRLEAFRGRNPVMTWSWFVQTTRRISEHDFRVLIGQKIME